MIRRLHERTRSLVLAGVAIAGQVLVAILTIFLARELSLEQFEAYAVVSAAFVLLVAIAPLGAEKLSLRMLPPLLERGDWSGVRGYIHFALRRVAVGSIIAGILGLLWALVFRDLPQTAVATFLLALVALPVAVLAHLGLEVLTAAGAVRYATTVFRLTVPAAALAAIFVASTFIVPLTSVAALTAWGLGWMVCCALLFVRLCKIYLPGLRSVPPRIEATWHRSAWPFWNYRVAVALMAQSGIIALDWLGSSPVEIGSYAAASTIVGVTLVLASSTNRAYASEIAVHLDRRAVDELKRLERRRWLWLVPCLVAILAGAFLYARPLLAWFRPEFVEEGLWPVRILAIAVAFTMAMGLAPTVLKFRDRNRALFQTVGAAALLQLLLLLVLVPRYGGTGAALAYATSAIGMYGWFAVLAKGELGRFRSEDPEEGSAEVHPDL